MWIVTYAIVCRACGASRVDLGVLLDLRDPAREFEKHVDLLIEWASRAGWQNGYCPDCARLIGAPRAPLGAEC